MYKEIVDKFKNYIPVIVAVVLMGIVFPLERRLIKFIEREDLVQYIQSNRAWIHVVITLFVGIFAICLICTVLSIFVMSYLRKNSNELKK
jgi:ABC-type Co2+ transport system permease subunit